MSPTCAVGSLVGGLPFQAFVLPLGQSRQLGGDLLLHGGRLVHLVGGADQLDGQLGLGGQRSHALLARRNLRRGFRSIRATGQVVELRGRGQTAASVHHAAPERLVAPGLRGRGELRSSTESKLAFKQWGFTGDVRTFVGYSTLIQH